jgi:hypothetical protein
VRCKAVACVRARGRAARAWVEVVFLESVFDPYTVAVKNVS